jgi:hypothetical protein
MTVVILEDAAAEIVDLVRVTSVKLSSEPET